MINLYWFVLLGAGLWTLLDIGSHEDNKFMLFCKDITIIILTIKLLMLT